MLVRICKGLIQTPLAGQSADECRAACCANVKCEAFHFDGASCWQGSPAADACDGAMIGGAAQDSGRKLHTLGGEGSGGGGLDGSLPSQPMAWDEGMPSGGGEGGGDGDGRMPGDQTHKLPREGAGQPPAPVTAGPSALIALVAGGGLAAVLVLALACAVCALSRRQKLIVPYADGIYGGGGGGGDGKSTDADPTVREGVRARQPRLSVKTRLRKADRAQAEAEDDPSTPSPPPRPPSDAAAQGPKTPLGRLQVKGRHGRVTPGTCGSSQDGPTPASYWTATCTDPSSSVLTQSIAAASQTLDPRGARAGAIVLVGAPSTPQPPVAALVAADASIHTACSSSSGTAASAAPSRPRSRRPTPMPIIRPSIVPPLTWNLAAVGSAPTRQRIPAEDRYQVGGVGGMTADEVDGLDGEELLSWRTPRGVPARGVADSVDPASRISRSPHNRPQSIPSKHRASMVSSPRAHPQLVPPAPPPMPVRDAWGTPRSSPRAESSWGPEIGKEAGAGAVGAVGAVLPAMARRRGWARRAELLAAEERRLRTERQVERLERSERIEQAAATVQSAMRRHFNRRIREQLATACSSRDALPNPAPPPLVRDLASLRAEEHGGLVGGSNGLAGTT